MLKNLFYMALAFLLSLGVAGAHPGFAKSNDQKLAKANIQVLSGSGNYTVKKIAAYPLQYSTDTPEGADPEHLEFRFTDSKAVLNIFSIEGAQSPTFKKEFPAYPGSITDLSVILKNKPKSIKDMPLIPWFEGVSTVNAHVSYGSSKSGDIKYARLLQFFQQDAREVTNDELLYYAQGLSNNKKFYVSLVCHVHAPGLKDKPSENWSKKQWEEFEKNGKTYYANINKTLAATTDGAFRPSLKNLDEILNSLTIEQIRHDSH